jgi:paraquat-inducible protein A
MNRLILLFFHILSLGLLVLGLVKDMMHIEVNAHFIVSLNLFNENRSVLGTLQTLRQTGNYWPFLLIFFFGIFVPAIKSAIIFYLLASKNAPAKWYDFVTAISKWAMADVFAISIFVAFLGANAMQNTRANLEPGFYYFTGYVLLSALVAMLLTKLIKKPETSNT